MSSGCQESSVWEQHLDLVRSNEEMLEELEDASSSEEEELEEDMEEDMEEEASSEFEKQLLQWRLRLLAVRRNERTLVKITASSEEEDGSSEEEVAVVRTLVDVRVPS